LAEPPAATGAEEWAKLDRVRGARRAMDELAFVCNDRLFAAAPRAGLACCPQPGAGVTAVAAPAPTPAPAKGGKAASPSSSSSSVTTSSTTTKCMYEYFTFLSKCKDIQLF
jgi:hypothetical protein